MIIRIPYEDFAKMWTITNPLDNIDYFPHPQISFMGYAFEVDGNELIRVRILLLAQALNRMGLSQATRAAVADEVITRRKKDVETEPKV